jgi:protein-S-isoprenylcysteine O-methyltransferase Ste14
MLVVRRTQAAVGSAAFFLAAPGIVVGVGPWLITRWRTDGSPTVAIIAGAILVVVGLVPVVSAFARFASAGGTPMPLAPTSRLVVDGFNRYVRNPMYLGLTIVLFGQALLFFDLRVVVYAIAFWIVTASFVRWYEEPTLVRQFGADYQAYRRAVPAWWPRWRPWSPDAPDRASA